MSIDYSMLNDPNFMNNIGSNGPDVIQGYGTGINKETGQFNAPASSSSEEDAQTRADKAAMARQKDQQSYDDRIRNADNQRRIDNASVTMKQLATDYNLMSLYDKMIEYIIAGYDDAAIASLIKTTPEYKQRFPAMDALAKKGRAMTEGEYIEYERKAAQLEKQYGLPSRMIQDNVTALLTQEISIDELNDRVVLASGASVTAPSEFKTAMKNYYGVDSGGLAAYYLDPAVAAPLLQKNYSTALIGSEAIKQNVDLQLDIANNLQDMGVTQDTARQGFAQVRRDQALTTGRGDVVGQESLIKGTFGEQNAAKDIQRARGARVGQFQGGGGFTSSAQGVSGLGSAKTK